MDIAVIGATGFVGRHLSAHLQANGHAVRAVSRDGERLAEWGDAVTAHAADVVTGEGLDAAMTGADGVVHLVAIPRESDGRSFEDVNVGGTRHAVEAAGRAGVRRFVHLSALGVIDDSRLEFLSSKWRGEEVVRRSRLSWVILRPSLLFGEGDGFFNIIKTTLTWWSPGVVAIPGDGQALFQPLHIDDLAMGIERCLLDEDRAGATYELGGAEQFTYAQIVDRVMRVTGKRRLKLNMPIPLISALTVVTDRVLPIFPVSHDQIRSLGRPNYTDSDAFQTAFGFAPRPFNIDYLAN